MGERQRSVIFTVFEGNNSLPSDRKNVRELLLSDSTFFSVFLYLIFHCLSPYCVFEPGQNK